MSTLLSSLKSFSAESILQTLMDDPNALPLIENTFILEIQEKLFEIANRNFVGSPELNNALLSRIYVFEMTTLRLSHWAINEYALDLLQKKGASLRVLDISGTTCGNEGLKRVAKYCPELVALKTDFCPSGLNEVFKSCPLLSELEIVWGLPDSSSSISVNLLKKLTINLTREHFCSNTISGMGMLLESSQSLERLIINGEGDDDYVFDETIILAISKIPAMQELILTNIGLTTYSFKSLLLACQNVKILKIEGPCVGTSTIEAICRYGNHIQQLELVGKLLAKDFNEGETIQDVIDSQLELLNETIPGIQASLSFELVTSDLTMTQEIPIQ